MTKITAHRGLSDRFPENTLLAFEQAVEHGADRVEMDVHYTADDRLVVHHTYELGMTDDGEGLIFQHSAAHLRSLDAGAWMAPRFAGLRIPFLEEVFSALGTSVEYELDLKGFDQNFLRDVLALVRRHDLLFSVELTSPYLLLLGQVRRIEPSVRTGMFASSVVEGWMPADLQRRVIRSTAALGGIDIVHVPVELLAPRFAGELHADGYRVHAADCDSREDLEKAFALNVDQLSTVHVDLASEIRDSRLR